jgi:hypothetical protein
VIAATFCAARVIAATNSHTAATGYGGALGVTTTWTDTAQAVAANLCTASATSTSTVHFANGTACQITKTTEFPTCLPPS